MTGNVGSLVKSKKGEIIELAKELIRIPTVNPPGSNYSVIVNVISRALRGTGLKTRIHSRNGKPNLVARWDVGSKKTLHINGHYDVVPVTPNWKRKPFEPVVENGRLFGRGAKDMKGSLCAMVYAVKVMHSLGIQPTCNLELSFTCDEESGGIDGLGYLVKKKLINPDFAVILDGRADQINNAHKGVLAMKLTVWGKSYHAAYPHKGVNAFLGACELAERLNDLNKNLKKVKSKFDTREEIEKTPTLVVGGWTEGGGKFNTIPGEFSFTIDRRIIPEERIQDAKSQISKVVNGFVRMNHGFKVKQEVLLEAQPSCVDKKSRILRVFHESVKAVRGKPPGHFLLPGFLDMRFFVNDAKIDCINYGTKGGNVHGDDEFVYVDTILDCVKILILTATNQNLNKP